MKLRCILIDDEENNLTTLSLLLDYLPEIEIVGMHRDPDIAIESVLKEKPDILLLDIEMPGMNGFELLERLPELPNMSVVFVTAHHQFAIKAFKVNAIDYLLKPIIFNELKVAVQKVSDRRKTEKSNAFEGLPDDRISLATSKGFEFVSARDIIRCKGSGSYTEIFLTGERKILVSKNIGEFEEILLPHGFYRIHTSHIVNPQFIISYLKEDGGSVVMKDHSTVPISRRKKDEFLKSLLNKDY